jgi:hypothetical protein
MPNRKAKTARRLVRDPRRMTAIFDRDGFSPKLFARLIAAGFDVITYRKGKVKKLAPARFSFTDVSHFATLDGIAQPFDSQHNAPP